MTPDDSRDAGEPSTTPRGGRIGAWLDRTRRYGWLRFLVVATIVALLLRIPVVWLGVPIVGEDARTAYDWLKDYSVAELFVIAVVVGPILETAFAQALPILLGRRLFHSDTYAVLLSAWLFGWLHFGQGALLVLIMFTTGLVLAWTYVVWLERGHWQAFVMTFAVHALLNGIALGAAMAAPEVEEDAPAVTSAVRFQGSAGHTCSHVVSPGSASPPTMPPMALPAPKPAIPAKNPSSQLYSHIPA